MILNIFLKAFECAEKILNKSGRVIIKIPAGTYYLSSPILIKQPTKSDWKAIKIEGDGVEQSVVLLEKGGFNIISHFVLSVFCLLKVKVRVLLGNPKGDQDD